MIAHAKQRSFIITAIMKNAINFEEILLFTIQLGRKNKNNKNKEWGL